MQQMRASCNKAYVVFLTNEIIQILNFHLLVNHKATFQSLALKLV
jgi:hypothetical protein